MATIATRAILNNRNLHGAEINMREAVASFCSTYNPVTKATLTEFCERIGMDKGQGSNLLKCLEEKGEIKREDGLTYLLRLDDFQLIKITIENYSLLEKLAELGCGEARLIIEILSNSEAASENIPLLKILAEKGCKKARKMVETISNKVEINSTSRFLLHFFLFSKLNLSQTELNLSQQPVESISNIVEIDSTALKEVNGLNGSSNVFKKELLEESFSKNEISDLSEIPISESKAEKSEKKSEEPIGEGKIKTKQRQQQLDARTRPEISRDEDWLVWLKSQAEFSALNILGKYRDMLAWCRKNNKTPSRLRLLNWLDKELRDAPMTYEPKEEKNAGNGSEPRGKPKSKDTDWRRRNAHLLPDFVAMPD